MGDTLPFNIGDSVYFATVSQQDGPMPCPVCCGEKAVTLILGDGTEVRTPCGYCGHGYIAPRGVVKDTRPDTFVPAAHPAVVEGLEIGREGIRYKFSGSHSLHASRVFATRDEALTHAHVLAEEKADEARKHWDRFKDNEHKSYAWHVGYHMRRVKSLQREAEYHKARAIVCGMRARTPLPEES